MAHAMHPPTRPSLRVRQVLPPALGAVAIAAFLSSDDGVVLCPYRRCTGGDCPLCGATRAAGRLLRGDLVGSWRANPMTLLLALQVPLYLTINAFAGRTNGSSWWRRNGVAVLLGNLALAIVVWAVRLWSGDAAGPTGLMLPW